LPFAFFIANFVVLFFQLNLTMSKVKKDEEKSATFFDCCVFFFFSFFLIFSFYFSEFFSAFGHMLLTLAAVVGMDPTSLASRIFISLGTLIYDAQ